jgi:hypothetical protein
MSFTPVPLPPAKAPSSTGLSFSLQFFRNVRKARLTIRADLQEQAFGKSIIGEKFSAQVGRGSDEGKLRVVLDPEGGLVAQASVKGTAFISMGAWDLLPKDKRPAAPCKVDANPSQTEMIVQLPEWCKPSAKDGKLASEFRLKRSAAK